MGVKQHFSTQVQRDAEVTRLATVWRELIASANASRVIVFDATNVFMGLQTHPQVKTTSPCIPRLIEFREVLRFFLTQMLEVCRGAELHFVFDGASWEANLSSKEETQQLRHAEKLITYAEDFASYTTRGQCWQGIYPLPSSALRRALLDVLSGLEGQHKVFTAHSRDADLDMATALHAVHHHAQLLVSGDSDFCVFFPGTVLLARSLSFTSTGIQCKALSLEKRLATIGVRSREELLLTACLAGTDFTPVIMEITEDDWSPLVDRARGELAKADSWQGAACNILQDDGKSLAFLANFDLDAYGFVIEEGGGAEAWVRRGHGEEPVFGITRTYPAGSALDPVLQAFADGMPESASRGALSPPRLLRAYANGELSSACLTLIRHQESTQSISITEFIHGRPLAKCKREAVERLVAFLAGPVADSWDDEDSGREERYMDTKFEVLEAGTLHKAKEAGVLVTELARKSLLSQDTKPESYREEFKKRAKEQREQLKLEVKEQGMSNFETFDSKVELPDFVWENLDGQVLASQTGEEGTATTPGCADAFFFLATGKRLHSDHEKMVCRCLGGVASTEEQGELILLVIDRFSGGAVVAEHMRHLQKAMGVAGQLHFSEAHCNTLLAESALLLGGLIRWVPGHLQDVYCLCGGNGLIFSRCSTLDGGPVLIIEGSWCHRAKDGYKISVNGPRDEEVTGQVMARMETLLIESCPHPAHVERKTHWFKVTGIDAAGAFGFHQRVVICNGAPYTLKVKAFDHK